MKKKPIRKVVRKPKPIVIPEERKVSFMDKLSIEFLMFKIKINTFFGKVRMKLRGY